MMSKRSWVWQHFKLISDNLSMCNICHKMFKAGRSTTPMIRHMKTAHGLENSESETGPNSSTSFLLSSPLSLLHVPPAPLYADTDDKKLKLDKALVDVVVKDLQPFSIVEDEGFRAYTKNLDPEYNLPNRKLLKKMVENAYEKKKQQVQQELNEVSDICITTDMWTSINVDSFLTVTCHFINEQFNLKSYTLQTEKVSENQTGAVLANTLKVIFRQWNIESKVKYIVTDNDTNMLAAVQHFDSGVTNISCFAHILNLVVKKSLSVFEPLNIIRQKCCCIVSHFKSNYFAKDKLTEIQNTLSIEKNKLILETETRWNSTYEMFARLLEQKHAVTAALSYFDVPFELLTAGEWEMMIDCLTVLEPFFLLTTELCSETHVPISKVLVSVNQLNVLLNSSKHVLATKLREMVNRYFGDIESNSVYSISSMLDPRFKMLGFMTSNGVENAKKLIIGNSTIPTETDDKSFNTDYNIERSTCFWANFDTRVSAHNCYHTEQVGPAAELDSYMKEPYVHRQSNPLEYWKVNATKYPHLSKLAQSVLCCCATSVPCERVFSKAGNILCRKRNTLQDSTLNKLLLLNSG